MQSSAPLTIIVITHNRLDYTKRTIESLIETVPRARFLIYDNASTEAGMTDYLRALQYRAMNATIFLAKDNIGWGKAVNYCIDIFKNETANEPDPRVLISNNDVVYSIGWLDKLLALYAKYPRIGILGVWKHTSHGTRERLPDLHVKDDMPAVGWLMKRSVLDDIGPFAEKGPCATKGGNGEDTNYAMRAIEKGYWVCGPAEDVAIHIDGY